VKDLLVYRSDEFESFETPEGKMTPLFVNEQLSLTKLRLPSKLAVPAHAHKNNIVVVILKGQLDLLEGDNRLTLKEGDVFFIPGGVLVGLSNPYSIDVELLSVSCPPTYTSIDQLKERLRSLSKGVDVVAR